MKNDNNLITLIIVIAAVILLFGGFGMMGFGNYGSYGGMMGNWGYGFGGMWIFGWLFMVLVSVALVLFIIWMVKQLQSNKKWR